MTENTGYRTRSSRRFIRTSEPGVDECLECYIDSFTGEDTSVTRTDLRESKKGYEDDHGGFFFFEPTEGAQIIYLDGNIGRCVPLEPVNYGFGKDRKIAIKAEQIGLPRGAETIRVPLNFVLESVGAQVNDSMQYDFDKVLAGISYLRDASGDAHAKAHFQEQIDVFEAARKEYQPTGRETRKGICTDAGKEIRELLAGLMNCDDALRITISHYQSKTMHDATVVFDTKTGEWAVVNSKSPTKTYNLTPKGKLHELGYPTWK